uniref:Aminopeptidase n=1 Tax=Steinernema glaseri TaxID=37863 RepID=A0A1I7YIT6_9BILA
MCVRWNLLFVALNTKSHCRGLSATIPRMLPLLLIFLAGGCLSESPGSYPRLPTFAQPLHYGIHITPDLKKFTFEGTVEIDVMLKEPTTFVKLHAAGLNVTKASYKVLNSIDDEEIKNVSYDETSQMLTLDFGGIVEGGQRIILKIDYTGTIDESLRGIYRSSYIDSETRETKYLMVTQFESTNARRGFPCWDEPLFKAQFTISLKVDSNLTALSNTAVSTVNPLGRQMVVTFETTPIMSTYLVAMAVGEFEYLEGRGKDGPLIRVYTTPGKKHLATKAVEYHIRAIEYYNKLFDYPCPLKKVDALALPDFGAGAMENWGLITYRESAIVIDESKTPLGDRIYAAAVIGHEVGHFWFGNLITMKWWEDLWLKEGFATFLMYQFVEDNYPELMAWDYFLGTGVPKARRLDQLRATHAIQVAIDDPAKLTNYYDGVTYEKSAHLIRMLYLYLGEDFWEGMKLYIKRNQYSNAETNDLWQAFADATGTDVKSLMSSWTTQTGYPLITLSVRHNASMGSTVSLKEKRYLAAGGNDPSVGPWIVPLNVLVSKNNTNATFNILIPRDSMQVFTEDVATADFVQLNPETSAFCHVKYDGDVLFTKLLAAYQAQKLAPRNRFTLFTDTYHLVLAGRSQIDDLLDLIFASSEENSSLVLSSLETAISYIRRWLLESNDLKVLQKFDTFVARTFERSAERIGWEAPPGELTNVSYARYFLKKIMVNTNDSKTIRDAKYFFEKSTYAADVDQVVKQVVASEGIAGAAMILNLHNSTENALEKGSYMKCFKYVRGRESLDMVLQYALDSRNVRTQDYAGLMGGMSVTPESQRVAWEFVKENWTTIKGKFSSPVTRQALRMLKNLLKNSNDMKLVGELQALFTPEQLKSIQSTITEVKEVIVINGRQKTLHRKRLLKWLVKHGY